jgi:hypothetical protein
MTWLCNCDCEQNKHWLTTPTLPSLQIVGSWCCGKLSCAGCFLASSVCKETKSHFCKKVDWKPEVRLMQKLAEGYSHMKIGFCSEKRGLPYLEQMLGLSDFLSWSPCSPFHAYPFMHHYNPFSLCLQLLQFLAKTIKSSSNFLVWKGLHRMNGPPPDWP